MRSSTSSRFSPEVAPWRSLSFFTVNTSINVSALPSWRHRALPHADQSWRVEAGAREGLTAPEAAPRADRPHVVANAEGAVRERRLRVEV
jgi:hypothetical protein